MLPRLFQRAAPFSERGACDVDPSAAKRPSFSLGQPPDAPSKSLPGGRMGHPGQLTRMELFSMHVRKPPAGAGGFHKRGKKSDERRVAAAANATKAKTLQQHGLSKDSAARFAHDPRADRSGETLLRWQAACRGDTGRAAHLPLDSAHASERARCVACSAQSSTTWVRSRDAPSPTPE